MTFGATLVRTVIGVIGVAMIAAAAFLFVFQGPFFGFWLWLAIGGFILLIGVIVERTRYRSAEAEHRGLAPGPGGGEPGPIDVRFRPTDEVFVDPTSNRRMRVYVDSTNGDRRYVAEQ